MNENIAGPLCTEVSRCVAGEESWSEPANTPAKPWYAYIVIEIATPFGLKHISKHSAKQIKSARRKEGVNVSDCGSSVMG